MGCSHSKSLTFPIESIESEPRSRSTKVRPVPTERSDRIVEDCILAWILNDLRADVELEKGKLRQIVSTIKIFSDREQCLAFIGTLRVEKVFLIVPTLESIRTCPQLEKVYVLDPSFRHVEKNIESNIHSDIFYDIDSLCKQLTIDVDLCSQDLLVLSTSNALANEETNSKKQEATFLYGQLMREILYRLKFENDSKNEFVYFCRVHYADNPEQLRLIDDFEANYRPQKALWWLTRPCFIWRMLQRMQRTFEIDILYKLGFLFKHAHTQMTILQENIAFTSEKALVVYRGKTMFNEKFTALIKHNCNGLLSFGNFCTAYMDKQLGLEFVRRRLAALPQATGLLFEIHILPTVHSTRSPFALLDRVHPDEKIETNGVLFGSNTVFRIDTVEESASQIWHVKLTLMADDDPQLLRVVAPLRSSEVHANPLSYLGKLFMEMEEYGHAEQFFLRMLQDASVRSQPRRLVRVHNGLAANYMLKGDFGKALEQSQQALEVSLSYLPPQHTDLAPLYDAIGKSYFHLNDYQKAVENYEKAVDLTIGNQQSANDQFVSDLTVRMNNAKRLLNRSF